MANLIEFSFLKDDKIPSPEATVFFEIINFDI